MKTGRGYLALIVICLVMRTTSAQPCAGVFAYDCEAIELTTHWSATDGMVYPVITVDLIQQADSILTFYFQFHTPLTVGYITPPGCAVGTGIWQSYPWAGWHYFQINANNHDVSCKQMVFEIYTYPDAVSPLVYCYSYIFRFRNRWKVEGFRKAGRGWR